MSLEDCIEWTGYRSGGYGVLRVRGRKSKAHRVAWERAHGPIPSGMEVCHRCDNPPCVNVDHLWLGTHAENMADSKAKGRARAPSGDAHYSRLHPERVPKGSGNGRAKLAEPDVLIIRARVAAGETKASLSRAFGVSETAVRFIAKGTTWRHVA